MKKDIVPFGTWMLEPLKYNSEQIDMAKKAAGEVLKKTTMATLMAAVAIPAALVSLSNMVSALES